MKLRVPEVEVPSDDPFKYDLLKRSESGEALTELVRATNDPLVLSINAPWGEGKSTFVRMWRQLMLNEGVKSIYFNAWENDYVDDPFTALMGELELGLTEIAEHAEVSEVRPHLQKAKKIGAGLLRRAVPSAIKVVTAGLIDADKIAADTLAEFAESIAEEQIKRYEDAKRSVAGFKEQLAAIAHKVYGTHPENPPLVIFVDELDRCRPPYAVAVLEAVKHFFAVPGVVFVLSLDRMQLGNAVRSMYGADMDVDGYLRRFFDLDFNLPPPSPGAFCKAQFGRFGLVDYFSRRTGHDSRYERNQLEGALTSLFSILRLSLRDQERAFCMLSLAIRSTPDNYRLYPLLLATLIVLKIKNPELYREFVLRQRTPSNILAYLGESDGGREFLNSNYGAAVEAYLVSCHSDRVGVRDLMGPYETIMESSTSEEEKARAKRIMELLRSFEFHDMSRVLDYLVRKIDLVSNFRA